MASIGANEGFATPRPPDYNHEPGTLRAEELFRAVALQFRKDFRNFALTSTTHTHSHIMPPTHTCRTAENPMGGGG